MTRRWSLRTGRDMSLQAGQDIHRPMLQIVSLQDSRKTMSGLLTADDGTNGPDERHHSICLRCIMSVSRVLLDRWLWLRAGTHVHVLASSPAHQP